MSELSIASDGRDAPAAFLGKVAVADRAGVQACGSPTICSCATPSRSTGDRARCQRDLRVDLMAMSPFTVHPGAARHGGGDARRVLSGARRALPRLRRARRPRICRHRQFPPARRATRGVAACPRAAGRRDGDAARAEPIGSMRGNWPSAPCHSADIGGLRAEDAGDGRRRSGCGADLGRHFGRVRALVARSCRARRQRSPGSTGRPRLCGGRRRSRVGRTTGCAASWRLRCVVRITRTTCSLPATASTRIACARPWPLMTGTAASCAHHRPHRGDARRQRHAGATGGAAAGIFAMPASTRSSSAALPTRTTWSGSSQPRAWSPAKGEP